MVFLLYIPLTLASKRALVKRLDPVTQGKFLYGEMDMRDTSCRLKTSLK